MNAYYHIDTVQRHIQALGFTGANAIRNNRPVPVNAHFAPACSSFYSAIPNPNLPDGSFSFIALGDGAYCNGQPSYVDRGEDPDVIVHEYGHALQDAQEVGVA